METDSEDCEIVFLIDTGLSICSERDHRSEVLLTLLRILFNIYRGHPESNINHSHRNSSSNIAGPSKIASRVNIKWGVKFFNTSKTLARDRTFQASFKSFKLSHLEDFERKIKDVFLFERESKVKGKNKILHCPAKLLSTALTEALCEFKWSSNDTYASPVTRKRSCSTQNKCFTRRMFILTKAPCSRRSLRQFSNKMVIDSDIFIDSFMSPALLHEYEQKMKISVSFVDFSSADCKAWTCFDQDEKTTEGVSILKDAFRKLGGFFVSRDVIVCSIPVINDEAARVLQNPSSEHQQTFNCFPSESLLSSLEENQSINSDGQIPATLSCKGFQNLAVNLVPVAVNSKTRLPSLPDSKGKDECSSWTSLLQQTGITHFTLLGCVPQVVLCDSVMTCLSPSFLMTSSDGGLMSSLLQQLAACKTIGVLNMKIGERPSLTLALLQAQTTKCGFISLLNCATTFSVEKAFMQYYNSDCKIDEKIEARLSQRNIDQLQQSNLMKKLNDDIQKLRTSTKKACHPVRDIQKKNVFQSHCMNSWHVPGSTGQMSSLISKLHERLETLDTKSERDFLKQLQKYYAKEKHPTEVVQNIQPTSITPICGFNSMNVGSSGESQSSCRSMRENRRHSKSSVLCRGRLMVDKARSTTFAASEDGNESMNSRPGSLEKRHNSSASFIDLDLKTEEDLRGYLQRQYDQVLKAGIAVEASIQSMVTVTSQFMSNAQQDSPQKAAVNFIHKCLSLSSSKLKEKYSNDTSEDSKKNKITEYKLQALLLLEMESLLKDSEAHGSLTELVAILRALSFAAGVTGLKDILTDIVSSYSVTLPRLLVDIFDELMLPVPETLAKFASPTAPSSVWGPQLSLMNDNSFLSTPGSSQTASHLSDLSSQQTKRFQKFKQHPSFSDFGQKKQIFVKPKSKSKVECKKVTKDKLKSRTRLTRIRAGDCERAKRNLFSSKSKLGHSKKNEKIRASSRKKHSSSTIADRSQTLVFGTPVHKQTSHRHLQQQEKRRRRENIQPEVQVIAESPAKDDDGDVVDGDTTNNRPARYIVRKAFYSSKSQPSRNLTRSLQLAQQEDEQRSLSQQYFTHVTKSQGTLASAVRGESPFLSPKSRLIKAFMSSPSPTPKSKWKNKSCVSTTLRRSPRKSAKKLVFKENGSKNNTSSSRETDTEHAHIIFDGENANDFDLLTSPNNCHSKRSFEEGFKTPEKQVIHSMPDVWEAPSCSPSFSGPSLNLSFKNILSSQDVIGDKILGASSQTSGSEEKADSKSDAYLQTTPRKRNKMLEPNESDYASTPKRPCLTQVTDTNRFYSTPSKVKFNDSCLISSPPGNRQPPSLDSSTPGKSILKNSPQVKGQFKCYIRLDPVLPSSLKLTQHSVSRVTDISQGYHIPNSTDTDHCTFKDTLAPSNSLQHSVKDEGKPSTLPTLAQKESLKLPSASTSSVTVTDVSPTSSNRKHSLLSQSIGFTGQLPKTCINQGVNKCYSETSSLTHTVRSSPGRKQYSPALSSVGLLQLIKSPLVSPVIGNAKYQGKNTHRKRKSRKHLEWN